MIGFVTRSATPSKPWIFGGVSIKMRFEVSLNLCQEITGGIRSDPESKRTRVVGVGEDPRRRCRSERECYRAGRWHSPRRWPPSFCELATSIATAHQLLVHRFMQTFPHVVATWLYSAPYSSACRWLSLSRSRRYFTRSWSAITSNADWACIGKESECVTP